MASTGPECPLMTEEEEIESINELEEKTQSVNSLYATGNIYPDQLPYPVIDQIMKLYRLANAELVPRKFVRMELRRFNEYSKNLHRRLSPETIRPSFVRNLR